MSIPEYELRYSARRTLSIEINREARLIVHAPIRMPLTQIEGFIKSHEKWIYENQQKVKARIMPEPSKSKIAKLKEKARAELSERTAYYAELMGVAYTYIGITNAKTRFGSCSKKGNINYSWRLMLYPKEAWDYVVVHELCHIKHFDHSKEFWQTVEKYLPDYKIRKEMLK